jgi:hypothetical protein
LAQLSLQQGKIDVAVRMFERHTELARNELELVNALTYQYVSKKKVSRWRVDLHPASCRHRTPSFSSSSGTPTWRVNSHKWHVLWGELVEGTRTPHRGFLRHHHFRVAL